MVGAWLMLPIIYLYSFLLWSGGELGEKVHNGGFGFVWWMRLSGKEWQEQISEKKISQAVVHFAYKKGGSHNSKGGSGGSKRYSF